MNTLLDQAKRIKADGRLDDYNHEDVDLVIAYLNGEVKQTQVSKAKQFKTLSRNYVYVYVSAVLKFAIRNKLITLTTTK